MWACLAIYWWAPGRGAGAGAEDSQEKEFGGLSPTSSPCAAAGTPIGDKPAQEGTKHSFANKFPVFQQAFLALVIY